MPEAVVFENETPPDTSAGYTAGGPVLCPSSYTLIVGLPPVGPQMVVYRCTLDRRHAGNHRDGSVHWQSQGIGFGVEEPEV